jgi:hypothetical protein
MTAKEELSKKNIADKTETESATVKQLRLQIDEMMTKH